MAPGLGAKPHIVSCMCLLCSAGVYEDGFEILSNMCGKDAVNDDLLKQGVVQLLMQCFRVSNDKSGNRDAWSFLSSLFRFSYIFAPTVAGKKHLEDAGVLHVALQCIKVSLNDHSLPAPSNVVHNVFSTVTNLWVLPPPFQFPGGRSLATI